MSENQRRAETESRPVGGVLDRETVRSRLRSLPDARPAGGVPAAVLIGLVAHPRGPCVILTERTAHLKNHAAQVSFPGGRVEETDGDPRSAALREASEEIGLRPGQVEILGSLPLHETVSGFLVHPFVGWVEPPVVFTLDPHEVAEVFEVPLDLVLDPTNYRQESRRIEGVLRRYHVLMHGGHRIWGATAEMLLTLATVLRKE